MGDTRVGPFFVSLFDWKGAKYRLSHSDSLKYRALQIINFIPRQ